MQLNIWPKVAQPADGMSDKTDYFISYCVNGRSVSTPSRNFHEQARLTGEHRLSLRPGALDSLSWGGTRNVQFCKLFLLGV